MTVYFIQAESGPIKIGMARSPVSRLRVLQTAHFDTLVILATVPGNEAIERRLHGMFREDHIRGEWFRASEVLMQYIAENGTKHDEVRDKRFKNLSDASAPALTSYQACSE
jgi:hypothetical protein